MPVTNPRVAILGSILESNAFAPVTRGADFRNFCYLADQAILAEAARDTPAMPAEIPAFIQAMDAAGPWQPLPTVVTAAEPGGPAEHAFLEETYDAILQRLRAAMPVDAVYICSHGAMVSTAMKDADGELYTRVREVVGAQAPVVSTVDLHANISERMVAASDAIVAYRTNPHVDQRERAAEAAALIRRMLAGERPVCAHIRMPIVGPTVRLLSAEGPYADLIHRGQGMLDDDLWLVSAVGGFAYADTPHNGLTLLCYGRGERPARVAAALAQQTWNERERFQVRLTPVLDAVVAARAAGTDPGRPPVCLADVADNPGGGGRGNTLEILEALLAAGVQGALVAMFIDPALAARCHELGEGATFQARFQGSGRVLARAARVLKLADGPLVGRRGIYRGRQLDLGACALLQLEGVAVVVASQRVQCADPAFIERFGVDIHHYRSLTVKSRGHFRAGFDEYFGPGQILEVDAEGLTSPVLGRYPFQQLPRPVYPLDSDAHWPQPPWETP